MIVNSNSFELPTGFLTVEFAFLVKRSCWLSKLLHFRLQLSSPFYPFQSAVSPIPPNVFETDALFGFGLKTFYESLCLETNVEVQLESKEC